MTKLEQKGKTLRKTHVREIYNFSLTERPSLHSLKNKLILRGDPAILLFTSNQSMHTNNVFFWL